MLLIASSLLQLVSTLVAISIIAVISFSDGLNGELEIDGGFFSGLEERFAFRIWHEF
jgi:hypothetical protein